MDQALDCAGRPARSGTVTLERLDQPTLPVLQERLRHAEFHVLHFVGHGHFDLATQDGVLVLEDANKLGHPISGSDLGILLRDHRSLRLVVLNACEGAITSADSPFRGTAQSLLQQRIPAVVAMQFEISDKAAITFTQGFYGALADGYPVDAALTEAARAFSLPSTRLNGPHPCFIHAPKMGASSCDAVRYP